jgi:hypothetical protein
LTQLLIEKGVSVTPTNELGYLPKDVTKNSELQELLMQQQQKQLKRAKLLDVSRTKSVRPNYSTPDRFKLLRDLAEESSVVGDDHNKKIDIVLDRKKSENHYFRKGRVKETQQKVLTEEEVVELEKQRSKRQMEVAQLVKKSAVKNNPLFKKLEKKRTYTLPTRPKEEPSAIVTATESHQALDSLLNSIDQQTVEVEKEPETVEVPKSKRNSKVISTLITKSVVSSSVFVQADDSQPEQDNVCVTEDVNETQGKSIFSNEPAEVVNHPTEEGTTDEDDDYFESTVNSLEIIDQHNNATKMIYSPPQDELYPLEVTESDDITEDEDDEDDDDDDDDYEEATPVQFATRLVSPIYKSVLILNEDHSIPQKQQVDKMSDDSGVDVELPMAKRNSSLPTMAVEPSVPVRPQRSDLRRGSTKEDSDDSKDIDMKRMSGSQKATWTMSMSSWAAILDREFNLEELDQEKKLKEQKLQEQKHISSESLPKRTSSYDYLGSGKLEISAEDMNQMLGNHKTSQSMLELSSTLKFGDFETPVIPQPRLSMQPQPQQQQREQQQQASLSPPPPPPPHQTPPQIAELPRLNPTKSVIRKPIVASMSDSNLATSKHSARKTIPTIQTNIQHRPRKNTGYGKLYLHVNGIRDILLPLPKDRAYVRCVVSDGRFEYMSRYEILTQSINFDYECVIDTHPDMIITISLHVRPDYVMKSRTPFSRLFTSKKKKKESLSGYVNKDDGAIGQARFALAHMVPVCLETSYLAGFHCFNAWYSRSFKERHRQKKKKNCQDPDDDVLKVVGNFDVEMLYLPQTDSQKVQSVNSIKKKKFIKTNMFHSSLFLVIYANAIKLSSSFVISLLKQLKNTILFK